MRSHVVLENWGSQVDINHKGAWEQPPGSLCGPEGLYRWAWRTRRSPLGKLGGLHQVGLGDQEDLLEESKGAATGVARFQPPEVHFQECQGSPTSMARSTTWWSMDLFWEGPIWVVHHSRLLKTHCIGKSGEHVYDLVVMSSYPGTNDGGFLRQPYFELNFPLHFRGISF